MNRKNVMYLTGCSVASVMGVLTAKTVRNDIL